jgi:hypothetical protein
MVRLKTASRMHGCPSGGGVSHFFAAVHRLPSAQKMTPEHGSPSLGGGWQVVPPAVPSRQTLGDAQTCVTSHVWPRGNPVTTFWHAPLTQSSSA